MIVLIQQFLRWLKKINSFQMRKNFKKTVVICLLLSFNLIYAEGQMGLESIVNFGYNFITITNIFIYTVFIGILLKLISSYLNLKSNRLNFYCFLISFLIAVLLTFIFKDDFVYLLYNIL